MVIFQILFGGVLAAIIGGVTVHFLTIKRDVRNRRRAFRAYIQSVLSELETMDFKDAVHAGNPYFLYDWKKSLIPCVRTECARILEDIPFARKGEFETLMMQFSRQGHRRIEPYETKTYEEERQNLAGILVKMKECAKDW